MACKILRRMNDHQRISQSSDNMDAYIVFREVTFLQQPKRTVPFHDPPKKKSNQDFGKNFGVHKQMLTFSWFVTCSIPPPPHPWTFLYKNTPIVYTANSVFTTVFLDIVFCGPFHLRINHTFFKLSVRIENLKCTSHTVIVFL